MRIGAAQVGERVRYWPLFGGQTRPEFGVVTEVRDPYVMVRYDGDQHAKATRPDDLEPARRRRTTEDVYTNTPEDAAQYEWKRSADERAYAAEHERPSRAELEAEERRHAR